MCALFVKRTWIDIDLDILVANYRTAVSLAPESLVTCVIKSNAYGHGAVRVAQALAQAGCKGFAVSCAREGLELRRHGMEGEILVMGLTEASALPAALEADLTLTAASAEDLQAIDAAACTLQTTPSLHLKVNTGIHRLRPPADRDGFPRGQGQGTGRRAGAECFLSEADRRNAIRQAWTDGQAEKECQRVIFDRRDHPCRDSG